MKFRTTIVARWEFEAENAGEAGSDIQRVLELLNGDLFVYPVHRDNFRAAEVVRDWPSDEERSRALREKWEAEDKAEAKPRRNKAEAKPRRNGLVELKPEGEQSAAQPERRKRGRPPKATPEAMPPAEGDAQSNGKAESANDGAQAAIPGV